MEHQKIRIFKRKYEICLLTIVSNIKINIHKFIVTNGELKYSREKK